MKLQYNWRSNLCWRVITIRQQILCQQNMSNIERYFVTVRQWILQLWTEVSRHPLSIIFVTSFNFNQNCGIWSKWRMFLPFKTSVCRNTLWRSGLGLTASIRFCEQAFHGFVVGRLARYTGVLDHLLCSGDADLTCF